MAISVCGPRAHVEQPSHATSEPTKVECDDGSSSSMKTVIKRTACLISVSSPDRRIPLLVGIPLARLSWRYVSIASRISDGLMMKNSAACERPVIRDSRLDHRICGARFPLAELPAVMRFAASPLQDQVSIPFVGSHLCDCPCIWIRPVEDRTKRGALWHRWSPSL